MRLHDMQYRIGMFLFLLLLLGGFSLAAQEKAAEKKVAKEEGKEEKEKSEFPPFDEVVKGMQEKEGLFTLYHKDDKLYALIKTDQLEQPFFLAMTLSGGLFAGMQWDDMLCYWERQGSQLLLIRPELRHRAPQTTFEDVVARTYPSTIIRAVPILTKNSSGLLIDFSSIFKSDLAGVASIADFFLNLSHARFSSDLSAWGKIKVFPYNIELTVNAAFTGTRDNEPPNFTDATDSERSHRMDIHYSLSHLPKTEYKPRKADTRIGYFNTAIKDFSQKHEARSNFVRLIQRWHLEKADTNLEMSPPKNPIIFYIEKTVPYRFRRYVREGIMEWNKAFEKIGFVDAIVVRQQTETEFADLDPEDVRYNFFRWTTHDMGFAAGPSRVNPMTGQILDADIMFDDSILRYDAVNYNVLTPTALLTQTDRKLHDLLKKFGSKNICRNFQHLWAKEEASSKSNAQAKAMEILEKRGNGVCMFGYGMQHQLAMAHMIFQSKGKEKLPEEFIGAAVKETVMHEVGHTLGLYHNFKGSSWLSLTQINSADKPQATIGSIMDYTPINFTPKGTTQGRYVPDTIGPYDYWAIEYGYALADDKAEEDKMLANIAKRSAENGLAYGNDLYATMLDPDPLLIRWDLGDDQIAYARLRMKLADDLLKDVIERTVENGEDYFPVRRAFNYLLYEASHVAWLAARYIGGESLHWDHKGDANARPPFVVVPAAKQREALLFLKETILSEKAFQFSPELLNHLAPGVWWHWESDELNMWAEYPIHERILLSQLVTLLVLLNPYNLDRLHNTPLQVAKTQDAFTLQELLDGLTNIIWAELDKPLEGQTWDARNPFISSTRRNLQRLYLNLWIYYFVLDDAMMMVPEDARTSAWKNLQELYDKIAVVFDKQELLDRMTLSHLLESLSRIEQALQVKFVK